jgi:hypothetical protein
MDKVFSTRLDADLIRKINIISAKKSVSKKMVIEQALRGFINKTEDDLDNDILNRSFGAWQRNETPSQTISRTKQKFKNGFARHSGIGDKQ